MEQENKNLPEVEIPEVKVVSEAEVPPIGVIKKELIDTWIPRTKLGIKVQNREITDINQILSSGIKILEPQIVDVLLSNLESDFALIGQSKGKFGGGKRSIWRQTQRKTKEGNKPKFSTLVIVGDKNGHVGIGLGKAKETVPAREKAQRAAKTNIINIRRGCGSWACSCSTPHSIPFKVYGRCGSVKVELLPAPKGTGLATEKETRKLLALAGIKDIHSKTYGQTRTKINLMYAYFEALKNLTKTKVKPTYYKQSGLVEGSV
ncbi:30S ribosomal protein S5 [Candidatus Woesearchaeota archaeon]|nr:hypothetical protein [uncultured archaeon]AQS32288.1 hypothetical protein [uncultured archaeon]MBS3149403.1 30S ribosomal protein S5 [Candidatus Woesearchaeota archaeon]